MPTIRPSWPSADLWSRLSREEMTDLTPCPACGLPAAVHQRDVSVGAWFCPAAYTEADRQRMWDMARRAPKMPTPMDVASGRYGFTNSEELARASRAELQQVMEENPDFGSIALDVAAVMSATPGITLRGAVQRARDIRNDRIRRQAYTTVVVANGPPAAPEKKQRKPKPPTEPPTVTRKRRYDFEGE